MFGVCVMIVVYCGCLCAVDWFAVMLGLFSVRVWILSSLSGLGFGFFGVF